MNYEAKVREIYPDVTFDEDDNTIFSDMRVCQQVTNGVFEFRKVDQYYLSKGKFTKKFAWFDAWRTVNQDMLHKLEE